MRSIKSPWAATFDQFAGSIRESAIIAAPYITGRPVERLASKLGSRRASVRLDVLTNLHADSLIDGSLDIGALAWLCEQVPGTTVRHLRHLHAKAYVADGHTAIVTSANLTNGGLRRNKELGVAITDPDGVKDIAEDLREYGNLGVLVPAEALTELDTMAQQAQVSKATVDRSAFGSGLAAHDTIRNDINERLVELRTSGEAFATNPRASINAQFCDAVRYVLRQNGPMSTSEMNPLIQNLLPELCNDAVEHITIGGRRFGLKWKHQARNARVQLRRDGSIFQEGGRNSPWHLTDYGGQQ